MLVSGKIGFAPQPAGGFRPTLAVPKHHDKCLVLTGAANGSGRILMACTPRWTNTAKENGDDLFASRPSSIPVPGHQARPDREGVIQRGLSLPAFPIPNVH